MRYPKWLVAQVSRSETAMPATATVRLSADDARTFPPVTARFKAGESRTAVRFLIDDGYYSGNQPRPASFPITIEPPSWSRSICSSRSHSGPGAAA